MNTTLNCAEIKGIAAAVPAYSLEFTEFGDPDEIARIVATTGILKTRQAKPRQKTSDLCFAAAQKLLWQLDYSPQNLDGVVFVSQTPDYTLPATSVVLQHRLGMRTDVAAFDINYGCSGYIYGLLQAEMMIHSGLCQSVLVCVGDVTTSMLKPNDRAVRMVFGDAGSATLLLKGKSQHVFSVWTDGAGAPSLMASQTKDFYMDGTAIMNFALNEVPPFVKNLLQQTGWNHGETFFGFHQANRFVVDYLCRKMRLEPAAVPFACEDLGNTGPASIPVMLAREFKRLQSENRLGKSLLCGFGAGLSIAGMTLSLDKTEILELIEVEA